MIRFYLLDIFLQYISMLQYWVNTPDFLFTPINAYVKYIKNKKYIWIMKT